MSTRTWNYSSFMTAVSEQCGPEDRDACEVLFRWWSDHADEVGWGHGPHDGAMRAVIRGTKGKRNPFTAWTYGRIEVAFEYLKSRPPFHDEPARKELFTRLNAVPGVALPPNSHNLRPSIGMDVLYTDEPRQQLFSVMQWVFDELRRAL